MDAPSRASQPHNSWAHHYDHVLDASFGPDLHRLTSSTTRLVEQLVAPPTTIVDFGAGTGRLAIPLAHAGYDVTAVDPAPAMLGQLTDKTSDVSVHTVNCPMASFRTTRRYALGLCVFSVVTHLIDWATLRASCDAAATVLRRGGLFLIDLPNDSMFTSIDIETDDLIRCVTIEPIGKSLYRYREQGILRRHGHTSRYQDTHTLRRWRRRDLTRALGQSGLTLAHDYSNEFAEWGAQYLLFRREE
ncbi:MAG: methyltransferase domain-containing protein [Acidobacteriota bacterium]|nr:methyltransferase domain-containing protein [Acidobacteriota bacterium]